MKINKQGDPGQRRQGDVFIALASGATIMVPKERDDRGRVVLAEGEATGHAHAIAEPEVEFDGATLRAKERATLVHEEHAAQVLEPGTYEVTIQQEWTDEDEPRQVAD